MRPPGSAYLAALVSRLATTWVSRSRSPWTGRTPGSSVTCSSCRPRSMAGRASSMAASTTTLRSSGRAQLQLAPADAGQVQQDVHQPRQVPDLAVQNGVDARDELGRLAAAAQPFDAGVQRRQRVAQLVAQHGEEFVLALIRVAQRGRGLGALQQVGRLAGQHVEQAQVVAGGRVRLEPVRGHHAHQPATARDERRGLAGADAAAREFGQMPASGQLRADLHVGHHQPPARVAGEVADAARAGVDALPRACRFGMEAASGE